MSMSHIISISRRSVVHSIMMFYLMSAFRPVPASDSDKIVQLNICDFSNHCPLSCVVVM